MLVRGVGAAQHPRAAGGSLESCYLSVIPNRTLGRKTRGSSSTQHRDMSCLFTRGIARIFGLRGGLDCPKGRALFAARALEPAGAGTLAHVSAA